MIQSDDLGPDARERLAPDQDPKMLQANTCFAGVFDEVELAPAQRYPLSG
jgi:hypothetical protein